MLNPASGLPVSAVFVGMIYTSTKALQYLSVPVYTIFKNLTIVFIAYGEVLWFGGNVTPLLLLSFGFMALSSIVAAWADIKAALSGVGHSDETAAAISTLNAGYVWMALNVFCSAAYVLGTRKFIMSMNFKEWDSKFAINVTGQQWKLIRMTSHVLQQLALPAHYYHLLPARRGLVHGQSGAKLPRRVAKSPDGGHVLLWPRCHLHLLLLGLVHSQDVVYYILVCWISEQASPRHQRHCLF
jgi:hypothetical protein